MLKKINVPNALTLGRIILVPVFMLLLFIDVRHNYLYAGLVFAAASVTDLIDGKLARKTNQITTLGKLLDPLADKMLVTAALLGLMATGQCSIWITFIILMREFTVTSVRMIALTHDIVIPANIWGKLKTASQMIFILVIIALNEWVFLGHELFAPIGTISNVLLGITAALAVVSGIVYIKNAAKEINFFENN